MSKRKRIALLGSTGSIGTSTLRVVQHLSEDFEIAAIAAKSNIDLLYTQALEFHPKLIAVFDKRPSARFAKKASPHSCFEGGWKVCKAAASFEGADFTMLAMTGSAGLPSRRRCNQGAQTNRPGQ